MINATQKTTENGIEVLYAHNGKHIFTVKSASTEPEEKYPFGHIIFSHYTDEEFAELYKKHFPRIKAGYGQNIKVMIKHNSKGRYFENYRTKYYIDETNVKNDLFINLSDLWKN